MRLTIPNNSCESVSGIGSGLPSALLNPKNCSDRNQVNRGKARVNRGEKATFSGKMNNCSGLSSSSGWHRAGIGAFIGLAFGFQQGFRDGIGFEPGSSGCYARAATHQSCQQRTIVRIHGSCWHLAAALTPNNCPRCAAGDSESSR